MFNYNSFRDFRQNENAFIQLLKKLSKKKIHKIQTKVFVLNYA